MGGAEWNGQLWAAADCDCVQNSDAYILIQNFLMNYFLFIWMNLYSAALTSLLTYYVGAILSAMKGCVRHQLSEGLLRGSMTWILSRKSPSWPIFWLCALLTAASPPYSSPSRFLVTCTTGITVVFSRCVTLSVSWGRGEGRAVKLLPFVQILTYGYSIDQLWAQQ